MSEVIKQFFNGWTPIGQGLFVLLMSFLLCATVYELCKLVVVLFRGWPPPYIDKEDEE